MSNIPPLAPFHSSVARLVLALESLTDGDLAVDLLIVRGEPAIAPLAEFLLDGAARTIALPRCRAVRALGGLQAREKLVEYFERYDLPADSVVLFAEDAVRSAVAHELLRWKSDQVFETLLKAAKQRATMGLIEALGEFCRPQAIPFLFEILEDDLCRNAAFTALSRTPGETRSYAILSFRGGTRTDLLGPASTRRLRATAELICALGISDKEWRDVSGLLEERDPTVVLCIAAVGFQVAPQQEYADIVRALFRIARELNWVQEDEVIHLLDEHKELAHSAAVEVLAELRARGEHVNWLSPAWRILGHLGKIEAASKG